MKEKFVMRCLVFLAFSRKLFSLNNELSNLTACCRKLSASVLRYILKELEYSRIRRVGLGNLTRGVMIHSHLLLLLGH